MIHGSHISAAWQILFGVLLVCWPLLDTGASGAVTSERILLTGVALGLLATAVLTAACTKARWRWSGVDGGVGLCGGWFILHVAFVGPGETDPYPVLIGLAGLAAYGFCRVAGTAGLLPAIFVSGVVQSGIAFAQCAGLVASRHSYYGLTGSFPNPGPLGGWLCVAMLAAVVLVEQFGREGRKIRMLLFGIGGLAIGIVLFLTDSRAAWVGFAVALFSMLFTRRFRYKKTVLRALTAIFVLGFFALYRYKKESADGRLLIWRVSADVISQKPGIGHGIGTFPERYMFAQADYFARNPESRFVAVADQVSVPFNEWIGIVCEQGAVGGVLALLLVGAALCGRATESQRQGRVLLVGLGVFSLFSYPLTFPAFGLLLGAILARCANRPAVSGRRVALRVALPVALSVAIGGGIALSAIDRVGRTDRSRYVCLQEVSARMRDFSPSDLPWLDRQARRLPIAAFYTDLGDRWLAADSVERAEHYYRQAARMIPGRLRPYDGLFRVCLRMGQVDAAMMMARKIVTMPVKIGNTATIRIRRSAAEWLEEQREE
ncbi:O-antigen ligase family protein [uncultured Rikenella sp.]|uniref:O-antigen ligase family protein n=1 Tax=uncultured Rikenella sp. TaxID=368003 RepID=UPI002622610B|nr:O-antigen ligase family protein [uncultured Rikenella sp.]